MPVGIPDKSVFSILVRKKNFVDDVYYAISGENITVGHCGIVHLKYRLGSVESVGKKCCWGIFRPQRKEIHINTWSMEKITLLLLLLLLLFTKYLNIIRVTKLSRMILR
jgi:hypothetical protein